MSSIKSKGFGLKSASNPGRAQKQPKADLTNILYTIAVFLTIAWLVGVLSSYTMGGSIHILLALALIIVFIQIMKARNAA